VRCVSKLGDDRDPLCYESVLVVFMAIALWLTFGSVGLAALSLGCGTDDVVVSRAEDSAPSGGGSGPGNSVGVRTNAACGVSPGLLAGSSQRTLTIALDGDDANDGEGAPVATLGRAAELARPGDAIEFRAGSYKPRLAFAAYSLHGTAEQPIVVRPQAGERVIIHGPSEDPFPGALIVGSSSYVIIDGLEITNAGGVGLNLYESEHVTARRLTIHDTHSGAVYLPGSDLVIEDSTIHDCVLRNRARSGEWDGCVQTAQRADGSHSTNITYRNLLVYRSYGEALNNWYVDGAVTAGNVIYDSWAAGIYNDQARNARIENNYVYWTSDHWANPEFGGTNPAGIQVAAEAAAGAATNIVIANNVIVAAGWGIAYWNRESADSSYGGLTIAHNVIVGSRSSPIRIDAVSTVAEPCSLANNIVLAGAEPSAIGNASAWSVLGNAWQGGIPDFDSDPRSFAGDAALTGPLDAGAAIAAFAPRAVSLALDGGAPVPGVTLDFRCELRSATSPSLGAFERP
jgi:hypothetical protein